VICLPGWYYACEEVRVAGEKEAHDGFYAVRTGQR
jgi:hypothetical protein